MLRFLEEITLLMWIQKIITVVGLSSWK